MFSRTISYIYDRENGRGGNLGVIKMEIRDNCGKMQIQLKTNIPDGSKIGFYVWEEDYIKCCLCHKMADEISFDVNNVAGVSFCELGGVVMKLGEKICVAELQDREFDFARTRWVDSLNFEQQPSGENIEAPVQAEADVLVAQSVSEAVPEEKCQESEHIEIPDFLKRKKKSKAYQPPVNNWKDMLKYYDIVEPFNDGVIYCCVEIGIDDLKYLPSSCKNAVKNSFLLHGLYLHKHLLIGKYKCKKRQKVYVLGVPGNYENSEAVIATMFGFDNFKKAKREGVPDANFGYWYTLFKDDEINE